MKLGQLVGLLILAAAFYILWEIRQLLLLIFAAVVLANSLNLLAQRLQKAGVKRGFAVLLSVTCLLVAAVVFFLLIVPPFTEQFQELFVLVPRGIGALNRQVDNWINLIPPQLMPYVPSVDNLVQQIQPLANRVLGSSVALFSSSLGSLLNVLLVVVLGLMMLVNPMAYRQGLIRLFPSFYRRRVDAILLECEVSLGGWIVGAMISMMVVAVLSTIGLAIIGVPAALAQGVLSGLLNFIPNLGPTFSVVPPMLISLTDPDKPLVKPLLVFGLYVLIQQLESNLITPYVMAQQVSLLPAVTLSGQVFFATIFGFLGLLLAIPLVVVCQIWVRRVLMEDVLDRWPAPEKWRAHPEPVADGPPGPAAISDTVGNSDTIAKQAETEKTGEIVTQQRSISEPHRDSTHSDPSKDH